MNKSLIENKFSNQDRFINREISWLKFNERVLSEANNKDIPLFERVKFLSIAGSNLDEFFMVRVAGLHSQIKQDVESLSSDGLTPKEQMKGVIKKTKELLDLQNKIYKNLIHLLEKNKITLSKPDLLNKDEKKQLHKIFLEEIYPLLTPSAIDPAHPFPFIGNKERSIVLNLQKKNKNKTLNSIIVIPKALQRFIKVGSSKKAQKYIVIDDVINFFISDIFPDHIPTGKMIFRITRDSDVEIQEESEDLVQSFELALKKRRTGDIVRLEILENSDEQLVNFIKDKLNVVNEYIYTVSGLVGIQDIDQLCRIKHSQDSLKPFKPREVEIGRAHV